MRQMFWIILLGVAIVGGCSTPVNINSSVEVSVAYECTLEDVYSKDLLNTLPDGIFLVILIKQDNVIIQHTEDMQLMGEVEFTGNKDDLLVIYKEEGIWAEVYRRVLF